MKRAQYKIIEDDSTYFGDIPDFDGAWANAATLEECRGELQEVLEGWILLSVKRDIPAPNLAGMAINVEHDEEPACPLMRAA